ncbi:2-nitropropane dioxygenase [Clostridia bacterium]|nr:2-nitropropane dioxygenase [Clostridia bacterium]
MKEYKDITELLGICYPIVQGGMAWVSDFHLAAAVSAGGGLGLIAAASAPADWVRGQIHALRKITDKPFGVNIMLMSPFADEIMQVVVSEKVPIVATGAGNPSKYMDMLKEAGTIVIPVVASSTLAKRVERAGADAVVAEGSEAGGHIGETTTMNLVPQVVDAVSIPVIAAGGIADGRGAAAAFLLGAKGVQVGTRFIVAKEANVAQPYKDRVIAAGDNDTVVTGRFTGHPVRSLKNKLMREILSQEKKDMSLEEFETLMIGTLRKAVVEGDADYGSLMSGQSAGLVTKEQPAAEIIRDIAEGMKAVYRSKAAYFGD